ncbi:YjbE family putative metal transport protein [Cytobacillus sp. FSL K6-0265]|uniref:YjbE family putative metal transport protein n=1 Tax=Cytobacillus sp. FSL K6-0265 TaxID=2921448 RepID=UPI0030FA6890
MNFLETIQVAGIDILLSGDNAIIIALAAKKLPVNQQKKVILYGMVGAIILRVLSATLIINLISLPFIQVIGGILLMRIAFQLIVQKQELQDDHYTKDTNFWHTLKIIIISDLAMSIDNVIALTSVTDGLMPVLYGILISIPIILFGSHFILSLVEKYRFIIYLGAGFLMYTAIKMCIEDKGNFFIFGNVPHYINISICIIMSTACLLIAIIRNKMKNISIYI